MLRTALCRISIYHRVAEEKVRVSCCSSRFIQTYSERSRFPSF